MFDDFFIRALIAGIGVAIVAGPLGCLVIWRRLSYFGDTLAHSALLGVTFAYSFELNASFSVFIISAVIGLLLLSLQKRTKLPGDALLGILSHASLAIGLVIIGFLSFIRIVCVFDLTWRYIYKFTRNINNLGWWFFDFNYFIFYLEIFICCNCEL